MTIKLSFKIREGYRANMFRVISGVALKSRRALRETHSRRWQLLRRLALPRRLSSLYCALHKDCGGSSSGGALWTDANGSVSQQSAFR
jgi:hypothetical protein